MGYKTKMRNLGMFGNYFFFFFNQFFVFEGYFLFPITKNLFGKLKTTRKEKTIFVSNL